ncbi:MAG: hypothetical protein MRY72_13155 [Aquisalinus sp.]|nr:hypothetical protein [Aquisalinus sp.]
MSMGLLLQPNFIFAALTFLLSLVVFLPRDFEIAKKSRALFYEPGAVPPGTLLMRMFVGVNSIAKAAGIALLGLFTLSLNDEGHLVWMSVLVFLLALAGGFLLVCVLSRQINGDPKYWSLYRMTLITGVLYSGLFALAETSGVADADELLPPTAKEFYDDVKKLKPENGDWFYNSICKGTNDWIRNECEPAGWRYDERRKRAMKDQRNGEDSLCPSKIGRLKIDVEVDGRCKEVINDRLRDGGKAQDGVYVLGNADALADSIVVSVLHSGGFDPLSQTTFEGAPFYLRSLVSSNIAQGLVLAVWISFIASAFPRSRAQKNKQSKTGRDQRRSHDQSMPDRRLSKRLAMLLDIDPDILVPPPLSEPLPEHIAPEPVVRPAPNPGDLQDTGNSFYPKPDGPVVIPDEEKIEPSASFIGAALTLDDVLEVIRQGGAATCEMTAEYTKILLDQSIKFYEGELIWRPVWRDWFVAEMAGYQEGWRHGGNKLASAIEYGGRFEYVLRERKMSAKELVKGLTNDEICIVVAVLVLLTIRASFKVER